MRLARRFWVFMLGGILCVLAAFAVLNMQRALAAFERDSIQDHAVLGRAIAPAFTRIWRLDGKGQAEDLLARVNAYESNVRARWLPSGVPRLEPGSRRAANDGMTHAELVQADGDPHLVTYVPAPTSESSKGVIELRESTRPRHQYVLASLKWTLLCAAGIALWCGAIAAFLGRIVIGRPIRSLVLQARSIGAGQLGARVKVKGNDEIADLGQEMNRMAAQLLEAHERIETETAARFDAMNQLRRADRLATVGKLASGVAHELGTPLNVISGRARMIRLKRGEGEDTQRNARIVEEQVGRVAGIVRQLLDFARTNEPHKRPLLLQDVVSRVLALLQPLALANGVRLELHATEGLPNIEGDSEQLEQVFTNLIVNAIQAMKQPGAVRVSLETQLPEGAGHAQPRCVVAHVEDEGVGMPPEVSGRVFEPFFTTKQVGEGTGLGLSVAYGIIREHGGFMRLQTQEGRGSTFSVHLPA